MWNGVSLANLTTACDAIKQLWPDAIIYINESQDIANCNFNRLGEPFFAEGECLPETLDWFGYDYYDYAHTLGPESGWQVQRDGMTHMIYPRLPRADQRVVPTTLGFFPHVDPKNATQMAEVDAYCVHNADRFREWAKEDARVAGLFTFYWVSQPGNFVGMWDMPRCAVRPLCGIEPTAARPPARPHRAAVASIPARRRRGSTSGAKSSAARSPAAPPRSRGVAGGQGAARTAHRPRSRSSTSGAARSISCAPAAARRALAATGSCSATTRGAGREPASAGGWQFRYK